MKRKMKRKTKTKPQRAPEVLATPSVTISGATIMAEAGKPCGPDSARAVERLADAIVACAQALKGTQPGHFGGTGFVVNAPPRTQD